MKKIFFGVLGLLALASCSNDELIEVNRDGDEIAFSVVTNSPSRADSVLCNALLPNNFSVWAMHQSKTYIQGDLVEKKDGNKWENVSGNRYWPNEGDVTFFAHHNAGTGFAWNNGSPTVNFTVGGTVAAQKDFVYAKKTQGKPNDNVGQVTLNFRHALSQVVFMAKNTNPNLYVEIYGVSVCKVKGEGTFTYPTNDTDANMVDNETDASHDGTFTGPTISYEDGSWGTWALSGENQDYDVTFNKVELTGSKSATAVSLTNNATGTEFNTNAMLLLPQTTTAWNTTTKPAEQTGSYFLVKCKIYNVADGTVDTSNDVCLWGGDEADGKNVAIPVSLTWTQGKKYIYTFVFGDGNGGYDPDPDTPKPVLVPITFNVTVDDFVDGGNTDVPMETK